MDHGILHRIHNLTPLFSVWKGKTTVNCTMVKHGSGLIEVNGVKLQSFFSHDADCCLKALSPLYLIGKLTVNYSLKYFLVDKLIMYISHTMR